MRAYTTVLALALFSPGIQAITGDNLDVKLGLWETAIQSSMEGVEKPSISEEDLALLPEAQRAQIQGMMSGNLGSSKHCITTENLATHNAFSGRNKKCAHTLVSSSPSKVIVSFKCTGKDAGNGTITVNQVDSEHTKGAIETTTDEGRTTLDFQSKYLGPDCGDVG